MQNKFIFYIFAKDVQMGPIRACVDSFLWDADSKFSVTVILESPKVFVSLAIRIWEGTELFNFFRLSGGCDA